jgi:RNA polymerase sigma-70 factor (ECF subfamily)
MSTPTEPNKTNGMFQSDFETLYLDNREMVLQAAFRLLGNREDAEDALQTVFTRLLERPKDQRDFCKNPSGYLYRCAIDEALHIISFRERQKLTDMDIHSLEIPAPDADRTEADILRVRVAMAKLKPNDREILHLHYYENYTCREIARMQRKFLSAVLVKLLRARTELKKWILIQEKQDEAKKAQHERIDREGLPEASEA